MLTPLDYMGPVVSIIALYIVIFSLFRAIWLRTELYRYEIFMPKAYHRITTGFIKMIAKFWVWDIEKFMNYKK